MKRETDQCAHRGQRWGLASSLFCRFLGLAFSAVLLAVTPAHAIPPGTPITNTAYAAYDVQGDPFAVQAAFTVVTDAGAGNSPPNGIVLTPPTVPEHVAGAVVGTLTALDLDPGDSHSFVVNDPRFVLDGAQLRLADGVALDFETTPVVTVPISATDSYGATVEQLITIAVVNVNEAPTALALSSVTVAAGILGAPVGSLTVADPDSGDTHVFSVDDARFEVVAGVLRLRPDVQLPAGVSVDLLVTATDAGGLSYTQPFTISVVVAGGGNATIEILQHAPGYGTPVLVQPGRCSTTGLSAGPFLDLPAPVTLVGQELPLPATLPLVPTPTLKRGAALFIRVTDPDGNQDPAAPEQLLVTLRGASGDGELLELTESGPDSGVFVGSLRTNSRLPVANDCAFSGAVDDELTATYVDPADADDVAQARVRLDPTSRVFDAASGRLIDGVRITLVTATGESAQVRGDDGVVPFPATVTTGASPTDADGVSYTPGPGRYRYPVVAAGRYRVNIVPPNRFRFPSAVTDATLQTLSSAPYVLSAGSRGAVFEVTPGPILQLDLPLDLLPVTPTDAAGTLLRVVPGDAAAVPAYVGSTQCFGSNGFAPAPAPRTAEGALLAVPGNLPVLTAERFRRGDVVVLTVTEPDQDLDAFAPDTIDVDVAGADGDREQLRLTETGASTGVFAGYLQTGTGAITANDCRLTSEPGSGFTVRYVDPDDPADRIELAGVLDPGSMVFDSRTGRAIDGVTVTLIDEATGAPAENAVFANDGTTAVPATQTTGTAVTDGGGNTVQLATGSFRFPVVRPGRYRLALTVPEGYAFPSVVDDAQLQRLSGAPFALLPASRGAAFDVIDSQPLVVDVPVDPAAAAVVVTKEVNRPAAAVGDFVQYRVAVQNAAAAGPAAELRVLDRLPRGFRYVEGSGRLEVAGTALEQEPAIGDDGRSLTFTHPVLATGETLTLKYVTELTAAVPLGRARNEATVLGLGIADANVAYADLTVREDLLSEAAIIVGQVREGPCDAQDAPGFANARVLLEDGSYVLTDDSGAFHFEGVRPGVHMLRVDPSSLPETHELLRCDFDTRSTDTAGARFIDVQGGTLWRSDFRVAKKPPLTAELELRLASTAQSGRINYYLEFSGDTIPLVEQTAVVMLPKGVRYVRGSTTLNDEPIDDPTGVDSGALTYRLPPSQATFERRVGFKAEHDAAGGELVAKAMVMYRTATQRARTPVVENRLSIDGPTSLVRVGKVRALFEDAQVRLDASERAKLDAIKDKLAGAKEVYVEAVGHADARPIRGALADGAGKTIDNNYSLSLARADAVADIVGEELAVPPQHRRVEGRGADEPVASNKSDAGRARNRRVDVAVYGRLYLPSDGKARADSGVHTVTLVEERTAAAPDFQLPAVDTADAPAFDQRFLKALPADAAFVWPPERHNPRTPSIEVAVTHPSGLRTELLVNGKLVNPLTFEGRIVDRPRDLALAAWNNVTLRPGDNLLELQLQDGQGATLQRVTRNVHFSGAPIRAELVLERSRLVADGLAPPVLAVRLWDRDGYHVRPGTTGAFAVLPPYQAFDEAQHLNAFEDSFQASAQRYQVRKDGIAYVQLEPTTEAGEVQLRFEFDSYRVQDLRARLEPGRRDWLLVGLGAATFGSQSFSGDEDALAGETIVGEGVKEDLYVDGRLAFYAQGTVRGDVLLTMAYDSDKEVDGELKRQIDPNRFYTLYGDGSQQRFDAQSARQLYVRLERSDFQALVGDFDTGFDRSELSRYERTLNGARGAYFGKRWQADLFAAQADQRFVRDELRGDGTSGIYRLSQRNLIANSDSIRIVTRDRFRLDRVLSEETLTRFLDYSIDFAAGTVIFKQPVFSQDAGLNPIFIVAEYEVEGGAEELLAGGRVGYRLDEGDSEAAVTVLHDDAAVGGGTLIGADLEWRINPLTELRVEAARTDTDEAGEAEGYFAQLDHQGPRLAGRVYYRELGEGFGLGQQSVLEASTRRYGLEGEYLLGERLRFLAESFQQEDLVAGGERRLASAEAEYRAGQTRLATGLRRVEERMDGLRADSNLMTTSISRPFADGRMLLRADGEFDLGGGEGANTDYPSRALFGAEYEFSQGLALIAEQELSWNDLRDTQDTRFGVRSRPWNGAEASTNLERRQGENGERLFATTGFLQQWRLNDRWLFDVGLDRVHTLDEEGTSEEAAPRFNDRQPTASGSADNDFVAAFAGAGYRREHWDAQARLEVHRGDLSDKLNVLLGASRQLAEGRVMSASFALLHERGDDGSRTEDVRLRWGTAWRPPEARWSLLNRLDLQHEVRSDLLFDTQQAKIVNNTNANYRPNDMMQLALQFGFKYVADDFDGDRFGGATALVGAEYRLDLAPRWDLGVRGALRHSFDAGVSRYSAGLSVGHSFWDKLWVTAGYNLLGFDDEDFIAADYAAQGPWVSFRFQLDESLVPRFLRGHALR